MVWLVTRFQVGGVFDDAVDLHALPGFALILEQRTAALLALLEHGGEHRVTSAISLIHARRHGFSVGDVTGGGVQPSGLRTHAATGNVENVG